MSEFEELKEEIKQFCHQRDWDQFHGLKDLAIGAATEAGELLELFRFLSDQQIQQKLSDSEFRENLSDELADVLFFLIRMAERADIDLKQAFSIKMTKNAAKYPVEKARGSNLKYDEF